MTEKPKKPIKLVFCPLIRGICNRELCAWWIPWEKCCAMRETARSLSNIAPR